MIAVSPRRFPMKALSYWLVLVLAVPLAWAGGTDPFGPIDGLKLAKPEDKIDMPSVPAPKGAVILFGGKSLDGWTKRDGKQAGFKLLGGGVMEVSGGDIITKDRFDGKFTLHVE